MSFKKEFEVTAEVVIMLKAMDGEEAEERFGEFMARLTELVEQEGGRVLVDGVSIVVEELEN